MSFYYLLTIISKYKFRFKLKDLNDLIQEEYYKAFLKWTFLT